MQKLPYVGCDDRLKNLYHFLTTVDLPLLLCRQSKHGGSVLLCEVQLILGKKTERMEREGGTRERRRKLLNECECLQAEFRVGSLVWFWTHHQLSEHEVQLLKGGHGLGGLQCSQ